MSKIEKVCSTCKHYPGEEHCKGCTFDWKNADGNTHWEPREIVEQPEADELDFKRPKKIVGKLISAEILDKIRAEIENVTPKAKFQTGKTSVDVQMMIPQDKVLRIIDKYKAESEDK